MRFLLLDDLEVNESEVICRAARKLFAEEPKNGRVRHGLYIRQDLVDFYDVAAGVLLLDRNRRNMLMEYALTRCAQNLAELREVADKIKKEQK